MELIQEISLAILRGGWTLIVWTWWVVIPVILYFAWKNLKKARYVEQAKHIVLSIKIPKNNDKGPVAAEMMFASLHGILQPKKSRNKGDVVQEHLSFEIVATTNAIEFFAWVPEHLRDFVEGQVYAQYPTAEITVVDDYTKNLDIDNDKLDDSIAGTELSLVKNSIYPIKTFQNFDVDPLAGITGMLSKLEGGSERVWIQILAMPIDDDWREGGLGYIKSRKDSPQKPKGIFSDFPGSLFAAIPEIISWTVFNLFYGLIGGPEKKKDEKKKEEKPKLSHPEEVELTAIEEKANKLGFRVKVRVLYLAKSTAKAKERIQSVVGAFKQFNTTNLNGFQGDAIYTGQEFLNAYRARLITEPSYILNIEELASLYHLPHVSVETPNIVWTSSKKGEPPAGLPYIEDLAHVDPEITPLAMTTHRGGNKPFGIKRDDRRRHMYIIGKSGTGKSRLLESLAINDIRRGEGVAIVDPHGELIDRVLKYIPKERVDDVVYLSPADRDFPIAFNPLEATPEFREEVTNGFVSVLKKQFGYSWGPRLEYVLKHTVSALVEVEGSTMLGIVRMLTDKNYRKKIVGEVTDPVVQMFWLKEFASYNDKMATETIAPILNKVGQFTASPIIRNIVGQPQSKLDFAKIMNEQKILLVDLSTGKIGEANSELIGSMLITKIQLAAMSRAYIPENQRKDFYLYVDEFQNFATESFGVILSEARKYRLSLTVANQYIAQMDENVRDAVFGNVGTLISFRVGATDATYLEKEFAPVFVQNDLINLDTRNVYLNMLIDGVASVPFSAMTLDSPKITEDLSAVITAVSREKYGTPKKEIEENIRRWYNVDSVIAGVNANEAENPIKQKTERETGEKKNDLKKAIQEALDDSKVIIKNEKPPASAKAEFIRPWRGTGKQNKKVAEDRVEKAENQPTADQPKVGKTEKKREEKAVSSPVIARRKLDSLPDLRREAISGQSTNNSQIGKDYKKIDKNILRDIIKEVTKPSDHRRSEKNLESRVQSSGGEQGSHKTKHKETKGEDHDKFTHLHQKKVREVTAEEFHKLRTIEPHEKIKIKETKEIKPGETVKF